MKRIARVFFTLGATVAALPAFEAEALLFDDQGNGTMTPGMGRHLL